MCAAAVGWCCGYLSLEPALALPHWLRNVIDMPLYSCQPVSVSLGAWLRQLIITEVVWTHAGVPVMWPAAKLVESDRSGAESRRSLVYSISPSFLDTWLFSSSCRQITSSSVETGAMFLIFSSRWLITLSPSLPLKTRVRIYHFLKQKNTVTLVKALNVASRH